MRTKMSDEEQRRRNRDYMRRYRIEHPGANAKYYREHREEIAQRKAAHLREHPKEAARRHKAYRSTPAGKASTARNNARYRQKHKKEMARQMAAYLKTPNGKAASARAHAKRRGLLEATECTLTAEEWQSILERNKHRCYWCKKKRKLTQDHVIPLKKGGSHTKENVVPACGPCNYSKQDKIITLF